jgi:hypothetical protein
MGGYTACFSLRRSGCDLQLVLIGDAAGLDSLSRNGTQRRRIRLKNGKAPAFCYEDRSPICRRACKPDSVEDGHSSRPCITTGLQQPTRRFPPRGSVSCREGPTLAHRAGTHRGKSGPNRDSLPIWSCSVWGLPCLRRYRRSGALLPHLFTLTCSSREQRAVSSLWHWPSRGLHAPVPDVIRHTALRSPDFPLPVLPNSGRPACLRLSLSQMIVTTENRLSGAGAP